MKNLIAYIPTLNQRHIEWLSKHKECQLLLVTQAEAEKLLPRLSRNMSGIPTEMVARLILNEGLAQRVSFFNPKQFKADSQKVWFMPDEDISHLLAEKYFSQFGCEIRYEMIWSRWDMRAVQAVQPVISDIEVSFDTLDLSFLHEIKDFADRGPDWWRRVGAAAVSAQGTRLVIARNTHMPNEYETYIFGDPSINRDAGQLGKSCVLHAEQAVISECARFGYALEGGKILVSTFPCELCAREIAFSGIREVYFLEGYSSLNAQETLRSRGIRIVRVMSNTGHD